MYPKIALKHEALLREIARVGDFRVRRRKGATMRHLSPTH